MREGTTRTSQGSLPLSGESSLGSSCRCRAAKETVAVVLRSAVMPFATGWLVPATRNQPSSYLHPSCSAPQTTGQASILMMTGDSGPCLGKSTPHKTREDRPHASQLQAL
ncbi:MAG: hypothetical protein AB8E87_14645 [Prochlorococcus sp.]